ncbi:TroA family protein [Paraliomyxa miuraensis]|uniref:hypothetical protein n=1 Tax=Paraliomyxa miuraensis TaxID=376150 RepID=UPI0022575CA9|nr:hypothetical protein [Paraliomyxa miuraensis]MCX4243788.1 hypothetical protein [Paraliomyxa miuraensis]
MPWSRRTFLVTMAGAAVAGRSSSASADDERRVVVPHLAFGAIVMAVGGSDVTIEVDATLPLATMRLSTEAEARPVACADRLLLKGSGPARRRYLDDARNAPKLGAAVRDALRTHWPELGDAFAQRHKTWSRDLARTVLQWTKQLEGAGLRGKRVRDPHGRIYLLEWAGAQVSADGLEPPPSLRSAPEHPAAATADAYAEYVQALVDLL